MSSTAGTASGGRPLRAIVIGTDWAGEGHTLGLRAAGVDVVALVGRTPEPTHAKAGKLGIDAVRFDWRAALQEFRPDIVSIATTAAPLSEMALAAATGGCHVVCEKPLAVDTAQARAMLQAVEHAGVKHAYAATGGYHPSFLHTRALLATGLIGPVRLIEYQLYLPPILNLVPYSWNNQLSEGGGALNNLFTHQLQQVLVMTNGRAIAATGYTWGHLTTAPVGPVIHDFRELFAAALTPEQAATPEQRPFDADFNATVMLQLRMPGGHLTNALFQLAVVTTHPAINSVALFGDTGALYLSGPFWPDATIQHFDPQQGERVDITIPQDVIDTLPQIEDPVQRQWNQLFREFIANICGEGGATYPTFRDGWMAAEVIDIVRRGKRTALPPDPVSGELATEGGAAS